MSDKVNWKNNIFLLRLTMDHLIYIEVDVDSRLQSL